MNFARLSDRLRHDGAWGVADAAAYRLLRTLTRLHVVRLFELREARVPLPASFTARELKAAEVAELAEDPVHALAPFLAGRVERGLARCVAALDDHGDLASFVWLGGVDFPAEWVYGPPIAIDAGTLYLHNAVTVPGYRGRGLYPATAAAALRLTDARRLLFTVEYGNHPSLKAARRMGATDLGVAVTWGMPCGRVLRMPEGFALRKRPATPLREDELPPRRATPRPERF